MTGVFQTTASYREATEELTMAEGTQSPFRPQSQMPAAELWTTFVAAPAGCTVSPNPGPARARPSGSTLPAWEARGEGSPPRCSRSQTGQDHARGVADMARGSVGRLRRSGPRLCTASDERYRSSVIRSRWWFRSPRAQATPAPSGRSPTGGVVQTRTTRLDQTCLLRRRR